MHFSDDLKKFTKLNEREFDHSGKEYNACDFRFIPNFIIINFQQIG